MDNKKYLDIIFTGFSKSYSAYYNRTHKGQRVLISFGLTLLLSFLVLYPLVPKPIDPNAQSDALKVKQKKVIKYSQLSAPPPIDLIEIKPPTPKEPAKGKKVASKKFVKPTVKPDEAIQKEEIIPSQKELKFAKSGTEDQEGDSLQNVSLIGDDDGTSMEIQFDLEEVEVEQSPPEPEEEIFEFVENKASFPGGPKAMYQYLGKNIVYPSLAKDNGISGRVVVQFIVEKDGSITNVVVVRDIGGTCGDEAIRVIQKMPNWETAEQNGTKVRSRFTLPVNFSIVE